MNVFLSIVKAIPATVSIIKALISLVSKLREMAHDNAMEKMENAKTAQEVKDALNNVANHP